MPRVLATSAPVLVESIAPAFPAPAPVVLDEEPPPMEVPFMSMPPKPAVSAGEVLLVAFAAAVLNFSMVLPEALLEG